MNPPASWLAALPDQIAEIASGWALELGEPYVPRGQCAWVAPARNQAGDERVLKVGWRHPEAEHEADALRVWDGDGAVRCFAARSLDGTTALLLERCTPGTQLWCRLPATAEASVLLCTDLHAGNVLTSQREPWLAIDPKPFVGDPAYDAVQHMLNCDERLAQDPAGLANRMAGLLDLNPERVRLSLFARCAQESLHDPTMREPARRLAT